ncbi:MAG TPA: LysM peptidoglycan-binding domain-containing protein [Candidatus Doudnabacteria bacterium]|nr:LysM peptidoglycan-binding domain-containing protein [Candidatus Doudnabacteria bacterium]
MLKKIKRYWFISQYLFKKLLHSLKTQYPHLSKHYTDHHPSVQLNQKLNGWQYSVNFSSEILVGVVVITAAAINLIIFNPLSADYKHKDGSLASQLLRNHGNLNPQLADKQNTVSTKVANHSIFSQANANGFDQLTPRVLGDQTDLPNPEEIQIDDTGITKSNPDSVKSLVERQVTIYKTQPFDTVYTVSEKFGVSTKTIRETNSLPNNALLAGWDLIIPPVDGIVIHVSNPDLSLDDVAGKYQASLEKMIAYNGLDGPDAVLEKGSYLIVPGGYLPEAPKPVQNNTSSIAAIKPSVPKAAFVGSNKFARGHCTAYVAGKVKVYWRGNANMWAKNAARAGATVNRTPKVGSIIQTNESRWGHVGYIEKVEGSKVTFSEWNYAGLGVRTVRTLDMSDKKVLSIIHP